MKDREMNKETLLIIFTYKYPYDPPVEQFLDDEMKYLSQENVDILLVPISRDNSGLKYKTVETKENISINAIKREAKSKETIYVVLFSIRNVGYIIKDINITSLEIVNPSTIPSSQKTNIIIDEKNR